MVAEARLRETEPGLLPDGDGWFVVNARDARWLELKGLGLYCPFEGEQRLEQLGMNINVLPPGDVMAMYHREPFQEDFLVLAGEGVLIVEDEERPLKQWDFVHCPPETAHVIAGAGDRPCVVVAVGARGDGGATYPVSEAARRHGASVGTETASPAEAYARFGKSEWVPCPEGLLPDL